MNNKIVNEDGLTEKEFLEKYNSTDYDRPSVTADVMVFIVDDIKSINYKKNYEKVLKILLIKRKNHPHINSWAIPGGFIEMDETIEKAALRELKEETGIEDVYIEQLFTFSDVDRDPRTRVITTSYIALAEKDKLKPIAGDDAKDVNWFEIKKEEIEKEIIKEYKNKIIKTKVIKLSFYNEQVDDEIFSIIKITETLNGNFIKKNVEILEQCNIAADHPKVIEMAIDSLKNKIEHTQIVFSLMKELFTLSELQQVYELIFTKKEKPASFRRKIKNMVIETDKTEFNKGHRPLKLYKYNKLEFKK